MKHPPPCPEITDTLSRTAAPATDDSQCLALIAEGDNQAFGLFFDRYAGRLLGYMRARVNDAHQAQDLAQETFLRAFRAARAGAYTGKTNAAPWLFAIAGNCVIDYLRARQRRPLLLSSELPRRLNQDAEPDQAWANADGNPLAIVQRAEEANRMHQLLIQLPDEQQEVIRLRVFGGLTLAEVAQSTGAPLPTVKSRLAYALKRLAALLAQSERRQS
jgi:RNA polymerase sigma-70 factor, ECF subfamily